MLTKARVRNFQKLRDVTIKFGPRVTTIVGATEAGKSTFLRALLFVFFSRWKPAYHRHGKSTTTAEVWIDGKHVVRRKGKGVNSYTIDGKKLSAVGKGGVPPEVAALFGLSPANVQNQLDPPFWFTETPGAISKKLNRIVNLELIDETQARAAAGCRTSEAAVKAAKQLLVSAKEELKRTEWIDGFVAKADRVLRLERAAADAQERAAALEIPTRTARRSLKAGIRLKRALMHGERALAAGKVLGQVQNDYRHLEKLIRNVRYAEQDASLPVPNIDQLKMIREAGDRLAEERRDLEFTLKDAETARRQIFTLNEELVVAEYELKQAAKRENRRCPKCGQKIKG